MNESKPSQSRNDGGLFGSATEDRIERLHRMVADDVPIREIKRSLGMGHTTIKKYAPEAGWPVGAPKGAHSVRKLERAVGL